MGVRLKPGNPRRDADWSTGKARKVADGARDRKKQSAIYVDVTKTGENGMHPGKITREEASEALEGAERPSDPVVCYSDEYRKLKEVFPLVFSSLKDAETVNEPHGVEAEPGAGGAN
jgi:hypothetical protein